MKPRSRPFRRVYFKVGTAEIKNWYPVISAMNQTDLRYHWWTMFRAIDRKRELETPWHSCTGIRTGNERKMNCSNPPSSTSNFRIASRAACGPAHSTTAPTINVVISQR